MSTSLGDQLSNCKRLSDKNILITGGSSGIGRKCAIECSENGARVHLVGRDRDRLEETAGQLKGEGHSIHALDMREMEKYPNLMDEIVSNSGKLTGFIHAAGYQITSPLRAMNAELYRDIFRVNLISALELSRLITQKKNHQAGNLRIIFIAGGISLIGVTALTAYGATKAGLVGAARAMAVELAPRKICVNCVSPGYVTDTNMLGNLDHILGDEEMAVLGRGYPLGLGKTEDIAPLCAFLMSDQARWITGQNIVADGGATAQ